MTNREFKTSLYNQLASVTKAVSHASRLEMLDLLVQGIFAVEYIAKHTNLSVASASQHLQVLKNSGLVESERNGKYMLYKLAGEEVRTTWYALRNLAFRHNEEIRTLLNDFRTKRNQLDQISTEELQRKLEKGEVYLIDVRPAEEFEAGHITNALSRPRKLLEEKIDELPKDREIVVYCRGPLCLMADEAVVYLKKQGFDAKRMENGFTDWLAENRPMEFINQKN